MKNKFPLASAALFFAVLISIISCSKDKIEPIGGNPTTSGSAASSTGRIVPVIRQDLVYDPVLTGTLVMEIGPAEAKAIVTVYNDQYTYGPAAANATEGIVRLENIEPGVYNVLIKPINSEYAAMLITNVNIVEDIKTNLGTIILGY